MKYKILIFMLAAISLLTVVSAQDYMPTFWKYTKAVSDGDPAEICAAVDALDEVLPSPSNADEYNKMVWAVYIAATHYEKAENYNKALYYYEKFVRYAEWLQANDNQDHAESIKLTNAVINHLTMTPELYVACEKPTDAVYYGSKHEPRYGTFFGTCNDFLPGRETAHLLYVRFFDETVEGFRYMIPDEPVYLLVAWNVPNEDKSDLDRISSGEADDYIISNLTYLATLDNKVLLRFGAEVNCWPMSADANERSEFIETFKAAFRRISTFAKQYAPNVAMVYSPNDVSNMYVTAEDFYPGDEYVDWVGMSSYSVLDAAASGESGDRVDAYYFRGLYDNPIVKIRNIVEAFGDRKPILISECGFAYAAEDGQNEAHAIEKLHEFYTYVNMVYPQVKGVLYFNADYERKFKLSNAPALENTYWECIEQNPSMQAMLNDTEDGYARFSNYTGTCDTLTLCAYAAFPSASETSVSYALDGATLQSETHLPYRATLNFAALSEGKHTLTMNVSCGNYNKSYDYVFYKDGKDLTHNAPQPLPFGDVSTDDWFYADLKFAYRQGLINGKGDNYCPNDNMTYAEAVKIAACMHQLYNYGIVTLANGSPEWYDNYAQYALDNDIISFSIKEIADVNITRKEFVRIFHAALPREEYTVINHVADDAIPDVPYDDGDVCAPLIYDFYRAGILTGSDGGYFNSDSNILRSEVAAILTRMFDASARRFVTLD